MRRVAMAALSPIFLLILLSMVTGRDMPVLLVVPALTAMGLFPVTLAYVIVVHRAFGISVAVRQGLQYALARRGVLVQRLDAFETLARLHGARAAWGRVFSLYGPGQEEPWLVASLIRAFARGERMAKWNEALRIEERLGTRARFAGGAALGRNR